MARISDSTPEELEANKKFIKELEEYHRRRG
jgi:hypothetical protein